MTLIKKEKQKQKMNSDMKIFIVFSIIVALALTFVIINFQKPKVVVEVNGSKVNTVEFQFYYSQNVSQALQSKDPSMSEENYLNSTVDGSTTVREAIKSQTLSQVAQVKILLQKAKKDHFNVSKNESNDEWQVFKNNLVQNAESSQMTLEQFSKAAIGASLSKVEKYYKDYIKSQKYMAAKAEEMAVDEKELTTFYNDNKSNLDRAVVRHILVTCAAGAKDDQVATKKKLAESILEKVNNGGDFAALVKEYSEDTGSKDSGGMYEINHNGQMVPEFEDWSFSHKAGDTGIVKSTYGFHIMKLDNVYTTLEAQKKEIESAYKSNKYQSELQEAMNNTSQNKIEVKEAYSTF